MEILLDKTVFGLEMLVVVSSCDFFVGTLGVEVGSWVGHEFLLENFKFSFLVHEMGWVLLDGSKTVGCGSSGGEWVGTLVE